MKSASGTRIWGTVLEAVLLRGLPGDLYRSVHEQAPAAGGDGDPGVVPRTGFEPATSCSGGRRSIH